MFRQYMLHETITELDNRLGPRQFVRIHRSSIVYLDRIREIYRDGHGDGLRRAHGWHDAAYE